MRIATMVHGYLEVPRPADMVYTPIDLSVAIVEGLARKGHTIDFFGPIGTQFQTPGVNVHTLKMRPLARTQQELNALYSDSKCTMDYVPELWDAYFAREMLARAARGAYDLVHFHHPQVVLPFVRMYPDVPVAYTIHNPIYPWYRELFELYASPNQRYISISQNQRRDAPDLSYLANIYNGTDLHSFSFSDEHDDYLLCVGRIVPEKGVKEAIQVARETGHRLLIIGPVYPDSQGYFDQYIKPYLNDKILYLGFVEQNHLPKYYQKAKALLTPVQWEEPFGMTTIEAMACGTPVISLNRGAAPEIIQDGKTGYIVDSIGEMIQAVRNIDKISRRACRNHVKTHFSHQVMIDNYEKAFKEIVASKRLGRLQRTIKSRVSKATKPLKKVKKLRTTAGKTALTAVAPPSRRRIASQ